MLEWLQRGLMFAARFAALWRVMGLVGAFRGFVLARRSDRPVAVPMARLGRDLFFRGRADFGMLKHLYDPNHRIIATAARPVTTILDAGANIGIETLRFRHNHPDAHIVSVEPVSGNFAMLELNRAGDERIELLNTAVWSQSGTLALKAGDGNQAFRVSTDAGAGPSVEVLSIPDIMARMGWERISILKLDIEGAEHELFTNGAEAWIGLVDCIVMEFSDSDHPGVTQALFRALDGQDFHTEILGENIIMIRRETGWRMEPQTQY